MNTKQNISGGYAKPPYSLEDSINGAIRKYYDKSYGLLNEIFRGCFTEFANKRNIVIEELKKVLSDNGLDENTINKIVFEIDNIIFTHYDYPRDDGGYYYYYEDDGYYCCYDSYNDENI